MTPKRPRNEHDQEPRPIAPLFLDRPGSVRIDGLDLVWTPARQGQARVELPEDLLERFVALAEADVFSSAVAKFASNFGALQLCKAHSLPYSHAPLPFPKPS